MFLQSKEKEVYNYRQKERRGLECRNLYMSIRQRFILAKVRRKNIWRELSQEYDPEMIIVAPQLSDWGETSADQTIALVEYFLENYNIDEERVYAEGYSGGGETLSQVMGKRPDLFTAYLQCSSQWDGDYGPVVESRLPVYFVIGEDDEYYGAEPSEEAYDTLRDMYSEEGLSDKEIDELLVLDVKDAEYFESRGVEYQHGGGNLFAADEEIMGWLFGKDKMHY